MKNQIIAAENQSIGKKGGCMVEGRVDVAY